MKFLESTFEEYINSCEKENLHPELKKHFDKYTTDIDKINNMIFYGPPGSGKYTQVLSFLSRYSPNNLKYEKKLCVVFNKQNHYYKISDIHIEVDMSLLGCNAKLLWHEIFTNLLDIINASTRKTKIVVCKNFHDINNELLEIFYSYMQKSMQHKVKFIIISEHISFIPETIITCSEIISVARPSKNKYTKITKNKNIENCDDIDNIKNLITKQSQINKYKNICDSILEDIYNIENLKYTSFRDKLYNIFIYDINMNDVIWYIIKDLIEKKKLNEENIYEILLKTHTFFKYYNNNYRPIYHVENIIYFIIKTIYNLEIKP
uniref:AAA+ ATPase domain-containing protein n=1 Tax=viral metagenome TaxID=1070528 RepID=A0A6C0BT05_9ZZZZ